MLTLATCKNNFICFPPCFFSYYTIHQLLPVCPSKILLSSIDYYCILNPDTTDFTGGVYSFTIQPNEQETRVRVPILNDEIVEQMREEFSLVLSVQSQPGLSLGNTQTSIYIIDNDGRVTISLMFNMVASVILIHIVVQVLLSVYHRQL